MFLKLFLSSSFFFYIICQLAQAHWLRAATMTRLLVCGLTIISHNCKAASLCEMHNRKKKRPKNPYDFVVVYLLRINIYGKNRQRSWLITLVFYAPPISSSEEFSIFLRFQPDDRTMRKILISKRVEYSRGGRIFLIM